MTILAYHSVSDVWSHPLAVGTQEFRAQMEMVAARVVSLDDYVTRFLADALTGDEVAITFDDGYVDNATNAMPVLAALRLPATVYVPSDAVGTESDFGTGTTHQVVDWHHLEKLLEHGVAIGAHSASHADLRAISADQLVAETAGARSTLAARLGTTVDDFCYPGGRYDDRVVAAVRDAGYRSGVVTPRGPWGRQRQFTLRRIGIYRHDDARRFRFKLSRAGQITRWVKLATSIRSAA